MLWRGGSVWAIAGHLALTVGEPLHPLTLTDLRIGQRRGLRWPSPIGGPQSGADQATVDPSTKLIALSFSDPAYKLTGNTGHRRLAARSNHRAAGSSFLTSP